MRDYPENPYGPTFDAPRRQWFPYDSGAPWLDAQASTQSGFGAAGLILSLIGGIGLLAGVVISLLIDRGPENLEPPSGESAIVAGIWLTAVGVMEVTACILCVIGMLQPGRRRLLPVMGLIFSGGIVLLYAAIITMGMLGAG